ncbi:MAG: glutathione S-transferase family protein [Candidatus Binatia bacterium]
MGVLVDGVWQARPYETENRAGNFVRAESQFRNWVTADGRPGPTGGRGFKAEPERYHLYVSLACPWACRALAYRKLKKLENLISVSVVEPYMGENGWVFAGAEGAATPGATRDSVNGADYLHQVYTAAEPCYTGRVTVPVLWDKTTRTIVSNESSEIMRMLNGAFDAWGDASVDFYPVPLRADIDRVNAVVYETVNDGVYKCGAATTQRAYDTAFDALFLTLDQLEDRLGRQRYLLGSRITEADWRLFPTLVRFDAVYYSHFKCNLRRLVDYPNLWGYTRELYQLPGIAETVNLDHIKRHYYLSHPRINPTRIVPKGPVVDFTARHDRARLPGQESISAA